MRATPFAIALMCILAAGCAGWVPQEPTGGPNPIRLLRITLMSGDSVMLHDAVIMSDSVRGRLAFEGVDVLGYGADTAFARADVARFERHATSTVSPVVFILLGLTVAAGVVWGIAATP